MKNLDKVFEDLNNLYEVPQDQVDLQQKVVNLLNEKQIGDGQFEFVPYSNGSQPIVERSGDKLYVTVNAIPQDLLYEVKSAYSDGWELEDNLAPCDSYEVLDEVDFEHGALNVLRSDLNKVTSETLAYGSDTHAVVTDFYVEDYDIDWQTCEIEIVDYSSQKTYRDGFVPEYGHVSEFAGYRDFGETANVLVSPDSVFYLSVILKIVDTTTLTESDLATYTIKVDDLGIDETFTTRAAAREYLEDQYDHWFADDGEIAENYIYALMCYDNENEWDIDENGNFYLAI